MTSNSNNLPQHHGVITALVTPFLNGQVDYTSLEKLVEFQLKCGVHGFVVNGTTAESPTLTQDEVKKIFLTVKKVAGDKVPLILGTGTNSTQGTIVNHMLTAELGASAELVVVPYYNKPPQRGLVAHFQRVAETSPVPVILYNVPGRTITSLSLESIQTLMKHPKVCGIKEASGQIELAKNIFNEMKEQKKQNTFSLLSGDDVTFVEFMRAGGHGVISVMSNIIPFESAQWYDQCAKGEFDAAAKSLAIYKNLIDGMYVEANPIPVKWMLWRKGLIASPELRLPLMTLDSSYYASSEKLMRDRAML